jgi:2-C-methyl-D-erythritol 4-phosphate cytidylyltransferase
LSAKHRVAAVIVAGGSGSRFGAEANAEPKQFRLLHKYPLYIWSISKAYQSGLFADIVVTMPDAFIDRATREIAGYITGDTAAGAYHASNPPGCVYSESNPPGCVYPESNPPGCVYIDVIAGGATRQESVYRALHHIKQRGATDYVVIHDAARPFLSSKMLSDAVECVTTRGACTIGTPVSDTLKKAELTNDGPGLIIETVDRHNLYAVQTPQAAPLDLLLACHEKAREQNIGVTDDAAILETFGHRVVIFPGQNHNIKITVAEDLRAGELLAPLFLPPTPR